MSTISIIGSGGMASAIGGLAAKAGHIVEIMSRDPAKARALAAKIGHSATTGVSGAAPAGEIVILAVPYAVVLDFVKLYGERLAGKIIVDITNPVGPDLKTFVTPQDSFGAQEIVKAASLRCAYRQGIQHPLLPSPGGRFAGRRSPRYLHRRR